MPPQQQAKEKICSTWGEPEKRGHFRISPNLRAVEERPLYSGRATHEQQTSKCRSIISEIKHKPESLTTAAAKFFSPIASARLAPIVTLASTSFANSTFSLLTMVVVRSLRGNQLQTGEEIENSLSDYDT